MTKADDCKRFNGVQNERCEADIKYDDLSGEPALGRALRLPCILGGMPMEKRRRDGALPVIATCEHYAPYTAEEAEAYRFDFGYTIMLISV